MATKATPEPEQATPIVELMRRLDHIGKGGKNDFHNYSYRGIDQMLDAMGPILRELGMFMSTEIVDYQAELRPMKTKSGEVPAHHVVARFRYTIYGPDGSVATTLEGLGEGLDTEAKGAFKAASGAAKYAFGHGLMIPFESDDPDASDGAGDVPPPSRTTSTPATPDRAALVKEYARVLTKAYSMDGVTVPDKARDYGDWNVKQLQGAINKINGLIAEASK